MFQVFGSVDGVCFPINVVGGSTTILACSN